MGPDSVVFSDQIAEASAAFEPGFRGDAGEFEAVEGFRGAEVWISGLVTDREAGALRELEDLPTIEDIEFSGARALAETVCDADTRARIDTPAAAPWRWNCQLIITLKDGSRARGTGWFIGPGTVMTAGHCVYSHAKGGFARSIEVIPGLDIAARPYGSQTGTTFRCVKGWIEDRKEEFDYGCIQLPDGSLGRKVGYYGFAIPTDLQLSGTIVNIAGYPGDKPPGTMWFAAGPTSKSEVRRFFYMIDSYAGQSGSCVWRVQDGQRVAVGVHAYGGCPNAATRITEEVFNNMRAWRAEVR